MSLLAYLVIRYDCWFSVVCLLFFRDPFARVIPLAVTGCMSALLHVPERVHTLRGQTTDKQQRTNNHIVLPSRQVSSLISNDVFNINASANGDIRLNSRY